MEYILKGIFFLLLTTTTIVNSQDNNVNQLALGNDGIHPKKNITCYCTEDEQCDGDSHTCQLTQPHESCYESWTLESNDGVIRVTAG
jgi:hypothetical protein